MRFALMLLLFVRIAPAEEEWPMRGGNPARNKLMADLRDDLPAKPLWTFPLAERDPLLIFVYGWQVMSHHRAVSRPPVEDEKTDHYPAIYPLIVDRSVLYRDGLEAVRRRLGSGTYLGWRGRYVRPRAHRSPRSKLPLKDVRRPGTPESERWYRYRAHGVGSLLSHRDVIVAVEGGQAYNRIFGYHAKDGKTLWGWQLNLAARATRENKDAWNAWTRDFAQHKRPYFLGVGVGIQGRLYSLAQEEELALWSMDIATGVCRQRTPLGERRERGASRPAIASDGRSVFVVTPRSKVFAVDLAGAVRWSHKLEPGGPGFAFTDPIVVGDRLIVSSPGARNVVALEKNLGVVLWSLPLTAELRHIVGISQGVVVLAGRQVAGIELATGKMRWGPHKLQGKPYGRGFVSTRRAHVPSVGPREGQSMIERFDLATGQRLKPRLLEVPRLGNLLSVDGRLIVASADRVMCFSTLARELARAKDDMEKAILLVRAGRRKEATPLLQRAQPRNEAFSRLLAFARKFRDMAMVRAAREIATEAGEVAQVALVAALLGESPAPLRREHAKTIVHYDGELMTGSAAADKLQERGK